MVCVWLGWGTGDSPANETVLSMLTRRRSPEEARRVLNSKTHFCLIPTLTTMKPQYSVDALVRHAMARLITERHKECVRLPMWKGGADEVMARHNLTGLRSGPQGPHNTYKMQLPFKFVIAMPNEVSDRYLVEKILHPYLADAVAITLTPDVGKYANAGVVVPCKIDPGEVARVREYYRGNCRWMPFNTTPDAWARDPGIQPIEYSPYAKDGIRDKPVLEFVTALWEEALRPCVDKVIRLDGDDESFIGKLTEPFLLNEGHRSLFDGTYLAISMFRWFSWAESPLVEGLDGSMESLEGMLEQTPGWGLP